MLNKTKALVLHTIKYGESSLIVHCYTAEWGRRSFLIKGVRKSRRQHRVNYYQPLFLLELDVYFREGRSLQWIKESSFLGHIPAFQGDLIKSTQAIFLAEVLMKVLKEEEKNEALFDFLHRSVMFFESLENASSSFHLLFLFQLTRFLGFYPRNNFSKDHTFFNVISGSFSRLPSSPSLEDEAVLGTYWNACFDIGYIHTDQVFKNGAHRNMFLDSLLGFYKHHIDFPGEFKSLEILRTVFNQK